MRPVTSWGLCSSFVHIAETNGQEVIVRAGNYEICKAAFDKALFVYPTQRLELRQGARVICKSREDC
jgi:hypothetical protein